MVAAVCWTVAGMLMLVWCKQRSAWGYLLLSCSAVSAAVIAWFELGMMHAQTPEQYAALVRWTIPAIVALTVSLVFFIRLRYFCLAANFVVDLALGLFVLWLGRRRAQ